MFPAAISETILVPPLPLSVDWSLCAHPAGAISDPSELTDAVGEWLPAQVPGTVASTLRDSGLWSFDRPIDIDGCDWWFRTTFTAPPVDLSQPSRLCFDGLATLAEVWLNGERVLTTDNMFRAYRADVSSRLSFENELVIVFRSLTSELQQKRPRPRWKTNLVQQQQLRWIRSSLQGRIPGWSPPVPALGPWRNIHLESGPVLLDRRQLLTRLEDTTGIVSLHADLTTTVPIESAELRVGADVIPLEIRITNDGAAVFGELRIENAPLWWPHTHGQSELLDCDITVSTAEGTYSFPCPRIGFRQLEVDAGNDGFHVRANGVPVFCRGACWTVNDIFTLTGTRESLARDLRLARDAGANMLRVGGTMTYESDWFYELCDQLGILVWQDFMFANMDYPVQDESFRANLEIEALQQLERLAPHPSVAIYCGNSEVEQQSAMLGMPRELWRNDWFGKRLPELCAALHPGATYVPSTPCGGALPFHPRSHLTHYYGVGAYLRPVEDVRRADVRFTPECLGFSNVPESGAIAAITGGPHPVTHSPQWKQRVPRDTGAGWDFEDVRDHYLRERYGVDPVVLRSRNMPRYLDLSRMVTGEMMAAAFSEWRSGHSRNGGALVWFYKDLWPAAGWGILDSTGMPKAAYYALKRLWNSQQLTLTDEGLNGLHLHLTNETETACTGHLEIQLLREPETVIAREEIEITVPSRSQQMIDADEVLGRFCDVSYAYRFGPPQHDVVIATWFDSSRRIISEAFHVIEKRDPVPRQPVNIEATTARSHDGTYRVELRSEVFLHGVHLHAPGFLPNDNYFHLPPRRMKEIIFTPTDLTPRSLRAEFGALNLGEVRSISSSI